MAENEPSSVSKRSSKIPVRVTPNGSTTKVIVVDASHPSKSVSRIPIRTSKAGVNVSSFKIKVINSSKSGIQKEVDNTEEENGKLKKDVSSFCRENDIDEEETEVVICPPKICKRCDCDTGICPIECLEEKKARYRRFSERTMKNCSINYANLTKLTNKSASKTEGICPVCNCAGKCRPDCAENKNKQAGAKEVCDVCKCEEPCDELCDANKKKAAEEGGVSFGGVETSSKRSDEEGEKNIGEGAACACHDDKNKNDEEESESEEGEINFAEGADCACDKKEEFEKSKSGGKICEVCKCKAGCSPECTANMKRIAEEGMKKSKSGGKVCAVCKCKKPCNSLCEENKKKIAEEELNKSKSAGKVCAVCKCKKPCNLQCEENKKKLAEEELNKTKSASKVCEVCKCKKPCNLQCEENKKKIAEELNKSKSAGNICEVCKCKTPCNLQCEENKKKIAEELNKSKSAGKVCAVCKCKKPCNLQCEENKKKIADELGRTKSAGKVCEVCKCKKPCNLQCEESKTLRKTQSAGKICEVCTCKPPCNITCEENKLKLATDSKKSKSAVKIAESKSAGQICEACKCKKPCSPACEGKKLELKKSRSAGNICEACKCKKTCSPACEDHKKELSKSQSARRICEKCACKNTCNKECELNKSKIASKSSCEKKPLETKSSIKVCSVCKCPCEVRNCESRKKVEGGDKSCGKVDKDDICSCIKAYLETQESKKGKCNDVSVDAMLIAACASQKDRQDKSCSDKSTSGAKLDVIEEQAEEKPGESCVNAEIVEEDKKKTCDVCKCALNECHPICEEIKKLRAEIGRPPNEPCTVCECSPDTCNETCLAQMKSAQTTPTNNAECATEEPPNSKTCKNDKNNEISQLANELAAVIHDIKCSCNKAEKISKKSCKQTDSDMRMIVQQLRQKCKMKDIFIDAMISDLSERKTSGIFDGLLQKIACNNRSVMDFDRTAIANALPKPIKPVDPCETRNVKSKSNYDCNCAGEDDEMFKIIVIRAVGASLLIRWTSSPNACVTGYHIYVDGKVRGRVFSRLRTSVLIDCLDLKKDMLVEVYPMNKNDKVEPPAVKNYKACAC